MINKSGIIDKDIKFLNNLVKSRRYKVYYSDVTELVSEILKVRNESIDHAFRMYRLDEDGNLYDTLLIKYVVIDKSDIYLCTMNCKSPERMSLNIMYRVPFNNKSELTEWITSNFNIDDKF